MTNILSTVKGRAVVCTVLVTEVVVVVQPGLTSSLKVWNKCT